LGGEPLYSPPQEERVNGPGGKNPPIRESLGGIFITREIKRERALLKKPGERRYISPPAVPPAYMKI